MTDKQFIKTIYLPNCNGSILFVGYDKDWTYDKYVPNPNLFETLDYDVTKNTTHVCDFTYSFKSNKKYDHISLHGLWGNNFVFGTGSKDVYGHDFSAKSNKTNSKLLTTIIKDSIIKAHDLLEIGGTLEIGPNTNNINIIYDYLIDNKFYEKIFRINRGQDDCGNCIFWGTKLKDDELKLGVENLFA